MDLRLQLSALLNFIYTQELEFITRLGSSERAEVGTIENWSAKDNIAHISAYRRRMSNNLAAVASGSAPQRTTDLDQANAEIFAAHQMDSWERVISEHEQSFAAIIQALEDLEESDLATFGYFPWTTDRPLWRGIAGNSALHPLIHLCGYLTQHNQEDLAVQIYEIAAPLLSTLDDSPAWRGMVQYDLACVYALAGKPGSALATLKSSFELAPEMIDWARQDADLDSLHGEPKFTALLG